MEDPTDPVDGDTVAGDTVAGTGDLLLQSEQFRQDRKLVEDYATIVLEACPEHCLPVVALPWASADVTPPTVIAPSTNEGQLDMAHVEELASSKSVFVLICTFRYKKERVAALNIMEQIHDLRCQRAKCALAVQLMPAETEFTQDNFEDVIAVNDCFCDLGADDVLVAPEWDATQLSVRIKLSYRSWAVYQQHLIEMLDREPNPPSEQAMQELEDAHRRLIWEDIPREFMPHFHEMKQLTEESEEKVGDYDVLESLPSPSGCLFHAKDKAGQPAVVKIIPKIDVITSGDIEGINREFCFLMRIIKHPHIVTAFEFYHGPTNLYLVMEFIGPQNLEQYLGDQPGRRMDTEEASLCFSMLTSALDYCHGHNVAHRCVAPEHVVLKEEGGCISPKLVDFRSAILAKEGVTSMSLCGCLPCAAPEMLDGVYAPKSGDCWSVGVLLLEMAGGLGSFCTVMNIGEDVQNLAHENVAQRRLLAQRIFDFFAGPNAHAVALARMGGVRSDDICDMLAILLVPEANRATMQEVSTAIAEETRNDILTMGTEDSLPAPAAEEE